MSRVEFAEPLGDKPSVSWEPCCALMVDHAYQRMIEGAASQRLIKAIAENWDWRLCAPLTVSHREDEPEGACEDPGFYVIDGQHRLAAAELRGDIEELPCIKIKFDSIEDEARCFVSINSSRQQVSSLDRFHARVAAKDHAALEIKELILQSGLTIARIADKAFWKPLEVAFPDTVGHCIRTLLDGHVASEAALLALGSSYPDKPLKSGKDLFEGLALLFANNDDLDIGEVVRTLSAKRQLEWVMARDKHRALSGTVFASRAMGEVIAEALGIKLNALPKGHGQRRFETKKPGNGVELKSDHAAVEEERTLFPSTVREPGEDRVFKSGHNSSKIGSVVEKGEWKGFPIYTLTLEERASCPTTCKQLLSCYGNNMHLAHRFKHGPDLEKKIWTELEELSEAYPQGFVIRLHVLGDFYSLEYVQLWAKALDSFPALRVFGYTAHDPDSDIGAELLGMAVEQWERFALRFSGSDLQEMAAMVIDPPETTCPDNAFICPAQKGQTACCATCGACWQTEKNVAFLKH